MTLPLKWPIAALTYNADFTKDQLWRKRWWRFYVMTRLMLAMFDWELSMDQGMSSILQSWKYTRNRIFILIFFILLYFWRKKNRINHWNCSVFVPWFLSRLNFTYNCRLDDREMIQMVLCLAFSLINIQFIIKLRTF